MVKSKILVLAGTLAVSGTILLHGGDVVKAADESGQAVAATTLSEAFQNGTYSATVNLYKTNTNAPSMMSSMVLATGTVGVKNNQATVTMKFKDMATINMVKSWKIDGVDANKNGQTFVAKLPVTALNKTITSTIHVETTLPGGVPFAETQPVDLKINDLKLIARDPEDIAAEKAKEQQEIEKQNKQKADAAAKAKALEQQQEAAKAKAEQAKTKKTSENQNVIEKKKAGTDNNSGQIKQGTTSEYKVKLYKSGTNSPSMMTSMVSPMATVVTNNGKATITLKFKDTATINMVKSWKIDGVDATRSGQSFVVVLPQSDLGKILHSVISVATTIGGVPFSEVQPVDLLLTKEGNLTDDNTQPVPPVQNIGQDVPLTDQLSNSSMQLPHTATNSRNVLSLPLIVLSVLFGIAAWFKKASRK